MATTWNSFSNEGSRAEARWAVGLALSAAAPVAVYVLAGIGSKIVDIVPLIAPPFGLPGWVVAAAMLVTLPMWGAAAWLVAQHGPAGRVAALWIGALIGGTVLLPYALGVASPFMASLMSIVVLMAGIIAAMRAMALSPLAGALLLPGLVWLGVGSLIGFTTLAGGWSPPFALIQTEQA